MSDKEHMESYQRAKRDYYSSLYDIKYRILVLILGWITWIFYANSASSDLFAMLIGIVIGFIITDFDKKKKAEKWLKANS